MDWVNGCSGPTPSEADQTWRDTVSTRRFVPCITDMEDTRAAAMSCASAGPGMVRDDLATDDEVQAICSLQPIEIQGFLVKITH